MHIQWADTFTGTHGGQEAGIMDTEAFTDIIGAISHTTITMAFTQDTHSHTGVIISMAHAYQSVEQQQGQAQTSLAQGAIPEGSLH